MRILVVEDDPVLSDGLRVGLSLFGATLDTVSSCADGRAALALTEFDTLVLDLGLPDGCGLDLLRELRARGDRTPVLLLTAFPIVSKGWMRVRTTTSANRSIWTNWALACGR